MTHFFLLWCSGYATGARSCSTFRERLFSLSPDVSVPIFCKTGKVYSKRSFLKSKHEPKINQASNALQKQIWIMVHRNNETEHGIILSPASNNATERGWESLRIARLRLIRSLKHKNAQKPLPVWQWDSRKPRCWKRRRWEPRCTVLEAKK